MPRLVPKLLLSKNKNKERRDQPRQTKASANRGRSFFPGRNNSHDAQAVPNNDPRFATRSNDALAQSMLAALALHEGTLASRSVKTHNSRRILGTFCNEETYGSQASTQASSSIGSSEIPADRSHTSSTFATTVLAEVENETITSEVSEGVSSCGNDSFSYYLKKKPCFFADGGALSNRILQQQDQPDTRRFMERTSSEQITEGSSQPSENSAGHQAQSRTN